MSERANALTLLLSALPLLAAWGYQVSTPDEPRYQLAIQVSVIAFCAVLVALVLQAIAADRRLAILQVARQSRQDMSTGLLNDRGLLAELGDRLVSPTRVNYGLIGLHVTNFDAINDLCGAIDAIQLEQSTAALLMRQHQVQFAARLSAGRYAMVIGADTVAQVRAVAREVYSQLNGQLFQTELGSLRLQCCVGGLLLDKHTLISSEDCLFSLSDALAIAASVRDPQLFVEPLSQMMIDARRAHQSKIEHIREAIRDNRIELFAQPVVDPDAPEGMLSYELLTRLRDRDGGLIQPPEFMTLAVQAQMSIPLDRAVIRRAFDWLAEHPAALEKTWKCSINLAGATMCDGAIADFIREQRSRCNVPASKVVFEITESEAIRNPAAASRLVDDLKQQGFGISLDDFGTGLATFEYLKRFPLDYVKIDGSFIRNLMSNPIDEEIVISTIRVAKRLKLRTVAEHVHSAAVYERLTELGITFLQGDYFGKAIPIREFFGMDRKVPEQAPQAQSYAD
jgi:EAL domain-containing protein (putative c-di-GMP-specific phosphodiesterase class I)/GGDEF domain-containing protein